MNDLIERLRLGDGTSPDHLLLLEAADALEKSVAWYVDFGNEHEPTRWKQCPSCGGDCGYTKNKGCQYGKKNFATKGDREMTTEMKKVWFVDGQIIEQEIPEQDIYKRHWSIDSCQEYVKQLRDKTRANTAEHAAEAIEFLLTECDALHKEIDGNHAMLERQTARIVDLQTHIKNFDGEGFSKGYHQAKSEWVELTEYDIKGVLGLSESWVGEDCSIPDMIGFAKAIDAKLKERNT